MPTLEAYRRAQEIRAQLEAGRGLAGPSRTPQRVPGDPEGHSVRWRGACPDCALHTHTTACHAAPCHPRNRPEGRGVIYIKD